MCIKRSASAPNLRENFGDNRVSTLYIEKWLFNVYMGNNYCVPYIIPFFMSMQKVAKRNAQLLEDL